MSGPYGELTHTGEKFASARRELEYVAVDPPPTGQARWVADGVRWVRIPLPMEPTHINVWLMDDGEGWTLVDTGMALDLCREAWELLERDVLDGRPLRRIFVTHDHPDHVGLAAWLQERHGAEVWMSAVAHSTSAAFLAEDPATLQARMRAFLASHGVPREPDSARPLDVRRGGWFGGSPRLDRAVVDGEGLAAGGRSWQVVETGGHCRGHLCLYDADGRLLASGDQVLPTISPNVSVISSRPEADPLRDFLASLERLASCAEDTLVLPAHGRPFRGLHRRLADVHAHHLKQLADLTGACSTPCSAFDLLPVMFGRPLRGFHRMLAIGETVAHLNYLRAEGRLRREQRDDGVLVFETA